MENQHTLGMPQAGKSVKVAYTGTAGTTTALPQDATVVRVTTTTDAFVSIGINPKAVADTDCYVVAFTTEYFNVPPGGKVSAVQVTAGGTLYVTPF